MTQYFVDLSGNYLGAFDGAEPPADAIEVPSAPSNAVEIWNGSSWSVPFDVALSNVKDAIDAAFYAKLDEGILWAFNQGETQNPISLNQGMRETLTTFDILISKGVTNPHRGYLKSNGVKLKKPDDGDLSDAAISEIALFSGQWALAMSDILITEKELCSLMNSSELASYDASVIDWTVTWDVVAHPDWSDNLVLKNP